MKKPDQNAFRYLNSLDEDELEELKYAYEVPCTPSGTKLDQIQDLLEANIDPEIANRILNIANKEDN